MSQPTEPTEADPRLAELLARADAVACPGVERMYTDDDADLIGELAAVLRALVGGRPAAPTHDDIEQATTEALAGWFDPNDPNDVENLAGMAETVATTVMALLSPPWQPPTALATVATSDSGRLVVYVEPEDADIGAGDNVEIRLVGHVSDRAVGGVAAEPNEEHGDG